MTAEPVRVHLGCCEVHLPGYGNVDFPFDSAIVRLLQAPEHVTRGTDSGLLIHRYDSLADGGAAGVPEALAQHTLRRRERSTPRCDWTPLPRNRRVVVRSVRPSARQLDACSEDRVLATWPDEARTHAAWSESTP